MLLCSPVAAIGWILIGVSKSNEVLFAGRIISSIAIASTMSSPSNLSQFLYQVNIKISL